MKTKLILLTFIVGFQAYAQDPRETREDKKEDVQTLASKSSHLGAYGGLAFKSTEFNKELVGMAGVKAGIVVNRALGIGFEAYGIVPTAKFNGISNFGKANIVGGYGGLFLEPVFFSNKLIHFTVPVSAGSGWLGYIEDIEREDDFYDDDLIDGDVFWYVEPGITGEINISKLVRLSLGYSRRFTQDLELVNTSSNAFNKNNFNISLKIGRF